MRHYATPVAGQDPETLLAEFPHKLAATRAGLGWIGKSGLLVTSEYGPRVRLGTILFTAEIERDQPITESRCGACDACVCACPYDAIPNALWTPGKNRDDLIDAFKCSRKRDEFIPIIGHKHECDLCLLACPVGSD